MEKIKNSIRLIENKAPKIKDDRKAIKINGRIVKTIIRVFILSSIIVMIIDYKYSTKEGVFFGEEKAYYESEGKYKEKYIPYYGNIRIKTPFGSNVKVNEYYYYYYEDFIKYFKNLKYGQKTYKDIVKDNILKCYFHDIWVAFLITFIVTIIVYLSSKYRFKLE